MSKITLRYLGKSLDLSSGVFGDAVQVMIMQQHCGGNTVCVFQNLVSPNECFTFTSRRHRDAPFGITIYLGSMMVSVDRYFFSKFSSNICLEIARASPFYNIAYYISCNPCAIFCIVSMMVICGSKFLKYDIVDSIYYNLSVKYSVEYYSSRFIRHGLAPLKNPLFISYWWQ